MPTLEERMLARGQWVADRLRQQREEAETWRERDTLYNAALNAVKQKYIFDEMPPKKKVEILPDAGPRKINFED